jgi:hypothetical protein
MTNAQNLYLSFDLEAIINGYLKLDTYNIV